MFRYDKTETEKLKNWLENDCYPLTIVADRYYGCYSGAKFIAWPCRPDDVPVDSQGSDILCAEFWWDNDDIICGKGETAEESYKDLKYKIKQVIVQRRQKEELEHERIDIGSVENRINKEEEKITKSNRHDLRCSICMRFISPKNAKYEFIPDSDYSIEGNNWICKKCDE